VPAEVQRFSGVIRGIEFAYNSAEIRPASKPLLDDAAKVLQQHSELQLEIVGHTDSQGARELNLDLSRRRAESVKAYLVGRGVDAKTLANSRHGSGSTDRRQRHRCRKATEPAHRVQDRQQVKESDAYSPHRDCREQQGVRSLKERGIHVSPR
jgi:OOP family OmpA-OmpF porin